jgi:hypothetical protein
MCLLKLFGNLLRAGAQGRRPTVQRQLSCLVVLALRSNCKQPTGYAASGTTKTGEGADLMTLPAMEKSNKV